MVRMTQWANSYLEREGLARLTISILIITTAGCLAYTWGYAEGVHNSHVVISPSKPAAPVVLPLAAAEAAPHLHHHFSGSSSGSDGSNETHPLLPVKRVHRRFTHVAADGLPAPLPEEQPGAAMDPAAAAVAGG